MKYWNGWTAAAFAACLCSAAGTVSAQAPQVRAVQAVDRGAVWNGPANDAVNPFPAGMPALDQIPPMPMPRSDPRASFPDDSYTGLTVFDAQSGRTVNLPARMRSGAAGGTAPGYRGEYAPPVPGSEADLAVDPTFGTMTIIDENAWPFNMACKVAMRFRGQDGLDYWFVCSGSLIDAKTVVLAAHCVYTHDIRDRNGNLIANVFDWAQEVFVFPGWDGNGAILPASNSTYNNYGWARSTTYIAGTDYINARNFDRDVAMVTLGDRSPGFVTGWFGGAWGFGCDTVRARAYNNPSYPSENCGGALHNGRDMYFWSGQFDGCPGNQLQINTSGGCFNAGWGGMSGSPAYYIENGGRFVHAVSSNSNRSTSARYAKIWEQFFNDTFGGFIPNTHGNTFDLEALDTNFGPSTVQAGGTTSFANVLVANPTQADPGSRGYTVHVYLSSNDNITTSDTLISSQGFSWDFGPVGSVRFNMNNVTIPASTPPGTYWLGAIIDYGTDGNISNNDASFWDATQVIVAPAAPTNDACSNATAIIAGVYSGNTANANNDGSASCGSSNTSRDVWFSYFAPTSGTVDINTCGSSYDTVLSVHTGCPGTTANQLAGGCNDDAPGNGCGGRDSRIVMPVTAFTTYYIRVSGFNGASGFFFLSLIPQAPANDLCSGAIAITPGSYAGTTGFAGTEGAAPCGLSINAPDVWYSFVPDADGLARFNTCGSAYDTVVSIHTSCPGTLDNTIGCNDDAGPFGLCPNTLMSNLDVPVSAGQTYFVRVSGYNGRNGAFTLNYGLSPYVNETCPQSLPLSVGASSFTNTNAATDGFTEANCSFCCGDLQVNQDLWYYFDSACAATATIDTFGSPFDTKIAVYASCPFGSDQAISCNDDTAGVQSFVTFATNPGQRYYVRIGGYRANQGDGVVNFALTACPGTCHGTCVADFDDGSGNGTPDGAVTLDDLLYYVGLYDGGAACADVDDGTGTGTQDGGVTLDDLLYFIGRYELGC
jgi:hypothetical protein